jgi:hypothetical protein
MRQIALGPLLSSGGSSDGGFAPISCLKRRMLPNDY